MRDSVTLGESAVATCADAMLVLVHADHHSQALHAKSESPPLTVKTGNFCAAGAGVRPDTWVRNGYY